MSKKTSARRAEAENSESEYPRLADANLESRVIGELKAAAKEPARFSTGDPLGLIRDLEASGRFHKDTGLGRIYHPGKISFRERKPTDALHILIDHNRVSAHIDRHSPLSFREGRSSYSFIRVATHNFSGLAEDLGRILRGQPGRRRCELECERVTLDGRVIEEFLHGPREGEVMTGVGPGSAEGPSSPGHHTSRRVPFNVIDEAVHLLNAEAAPWSIQMEIRVSGRLDESRLRASIGRALDRHPMARARKGASRRSDHQAWWEVAPGLNLDPLQVVDGPDDAAVKAIRADLQSLLVPLAESPPLRARLVRNPGGDYLMLNINHAATDGFGALRILHSIARAYAGQVDPLPKIDFLAARDLPERLAAANVATKMRRYAALAEKLRDLIRPPARLAREGETEKSGYGFHTERLSIAETETITAMKHPGTINDVLLTALHLAIAEWNTDHGKRCGRVGVLVPANLRPPSWRQEMVGNFSLPVRISTDHRQRADIAKALKAVTIQTTRKNRSGMGTALIEVLKRSRFLPLWLKQLSVALLPISGNRLVDTAMIADLGKLEFAPWFGQDAGETRELWFSAPARMPLGLSIGAATVTDRLHLSFRYRHRMFSEDAAARFAECYLAKLRLLSERPEARRAAPVKIPVP